MATNILMEVSKDEEARAYYESELIFQLDQNGRMAQARNEKAIEIAKNLLDVLDIETIATKTGLTVEEVEALERDN